MQLKCQSPQIWQREHLETSIPEANHDLNRVCVAPKRLGFAEDFRLTGFALPSRLSPWLTDQTKQK